MGGATISEHSHHALVTGGSQGIGFAVARTLLEKGHRVTIGDIREGAAKDAAEQLGRGAEAIFLDVRDRASIEEAVARIEQSVGLIDVLINNAGILTMAPALDLREEEWDRTMDVNAKGVFLCSQVLGRRMVKGGWGRIVNIASIGAKVPLAEQVHYCASKAAVLAMTRVFAIELARQGVTVNAVCPGAVDTPMFRECYVSASNHLGLVAEDVRDRWIDAIPLDRLIQPSEVGELVAFLASDAAASITGQAYNIDGGRVWS